MKRILLFVWLSLVALPAFSQAAFALDSLPANGVVLDKAWKWHLGDNPDWAKADFDDSRWDTLSPGQSVTQLHWLPGQGIGWLRIRLLLPLALRGKAMGVRISQVGASELFLNGQLAGLSGQINSQKQIEKGTDFQYIPFIRLDTDSVQVLAVRYVFSKEKILKQSLPFLPFYRIKLMSPEQAEKNRIEELAYVILEVFLFGVFLVLGILQLLLYAASTRQRAALYLGLFLLIQSIVHLAVSMANGYDSLLQPFEITKVASVTDFLWIVFIVAESVSACYYLLGMYYYFKQPRKTLFFVAVAISLADIPAGLFLNYHYAYLSQFILGTILPWTEILRVGVVALKQKKTGAILFIIVHGLVLALYIGWTVAIFLPSISSFLAANGYSLFTLSFLGLALTIPLLLSQERAATNKLLKNQLVELEALSQKIIAQEQDKQQLLATQNERLEQQVEARTAELKASQTQLIQKEKLASLGELTAGIAHEIQNPLNFVNNFSEVSAELVDDLEAELGKGDTDEAKAIAGDLRQNLQKITLHGSRASRIVQGMLAHSRSGAGERQPTDLNALAEEYLRLAYQGLRAKDKAFNCELVTDLDGEVGRVAVVSQEVGRVLLNLFNNAFYAVAEKQKLHPSGYRPTVNLSTRRENGQVEIRVSDNGTGIPDGVKAKIFQPFFTTKPTGQGTGLGLSLSYDIVTKGHGGTLTAESTEGVGTAFVVQLPATA